MRTEAIRVRSRCRSLQLLAAFLALAVAAAACEPSGDRADRLPPPQDIAIVVSIGDSFAAGEGAPPHIDVSAAEPWDFSERFGEYVPYSGRTIVGDLSRIITSDRAEPVTDLDAYDPVETIGGAATNAPACHRSPANARSLAFTGLILGNFYDLACTGATIDEGLLGDQLLETPEAGPNGRVIPPQLEQVADIGPSGDWILIVSIGGNDVGFADTVSCFMTFAPALCRYPDTDDFEALQDDLNTLADRIESGPGGSNGWTKPAEVIITTYPLPTRAGGRTCGRVDDWVGLVQSSDGALAFLEDSKRDELNLEEVDEDTPGREDLPTGEWSVGLDGQLRVTGFELDTGDIPILPLRGQLRNVSPSNYQEVEDRFIAPLNERIRTFAGIRGWRVADFTPEERGLWTNRGICAGTPWFNSVLSSQVVQGSFNGVIHPNCSGQLAWSATIHRALLEALIDLDVVHDPERLSPMTSAERRGVCGQARVRLTRGDPYPEASYLGPVAFSYSRDLLFRPVSG
ncbi:MAG: hypothetical protein AAFZ07_23385 [Actinomycetota bacterium]